MKDPLFVNKLLFSVLTALLLFFGLPQLAGALMGGGHHGPHDKLHLAYPIEFETGAEKGPKAPEKTLAQLLAEASAKGGERSAAICKSCHSFEKGGANGTGPNLWDIVNRPVASVSGFGYTGALQGLGGDWTFERLDKYIENSQGFVAGTAMVQRFPKATQRANLLAYLQSLSDEPVPFPVPEVIEEEPAAEAAPEAEEAPATE